MSMRQSTSTQLQLDVALKPNARNKTELNALWRMLGEIAQKAAIDLGVKINPKQLQTIKGIQQAFNELGISARFAGKEIEIAMKNASGTVRSQKHKFTGFVPEEGYSRRLKAEYESAPASYSYNVNDQTQNLITTTKEYEAQANVVNRLIKQGYTLGDQDSARSNRLRFEQDLLKKRETRMNEALKIAEKQDATEDSQLKHTIERTNETKQRVQLSKQEAEEQARLNKEAKDGAKYTGSIYKNIKSMLTNVVVYGTAYKALYAVMNGFKETINIVKELDKSLVDLQIATGKTREEASQMLDTYNKLAQSVGATTKQVADSATTWLRQGYSEADTNKLIYDSMVLSKVGMIESAEATKYLTSAMKGYQVSVDDAMSIVDKLSKIDLNAVTIIFLYDYRCAYCESSM